MIATSRVIELLNDFLAESPIFLVEARVSPSNQIRVILDSDEGIKIEDCVKVTRFIESQFDRETEDYELEVTSSGLDLPFKIKRQYVKNIGRKIRVKTAQGTIIQGLLKEVSETGVLLETEKKKSKEIIKTDQALEFSDIKEAKIIITF